MIALKRFLLVFAALALVSAITFSFSMHVNASNEDHAVWSDWKSKGMITFSNTTGETRTEEPVEVTLKLDKAKADGSDIRIVDSNGGEIPYQVVEIGQDHMFTLAFFVSVPQNLSSSYFIFSNNPLASKPDYGQITSILNNEARTWQTNDVFIQWGGKAGYYVDTTRPITVLKFDDQGKDEPSGCLDRITDDWNSWDPDMSYGYLGSIVSGSNPYGFGNSNGLIVANGPIFSELQLGSAIIRSYNGKKNWIVANGVVDSLLMFGRRYDHEKHGGSVEQFINNNGEDDVGPWITYHSSTSVNPNYMCFRQSDTGLIFGAIGSGVSKWRISAKESGGYDRIISFDNSSNLPNAKIYWYSDTSNSYEGIERFSKQVLNPLKVEFLADIEPPATTISVNPEKPNGLNDWYLTNPEVRLSSSEEGTTYYQIDDGNEFEYSGSIAIPEGEHTLTYYSVDEFGNEEQPKTAQFKVDTIAPMAPVLLSPEDKGLINLSNPIYCWEPGSDDGSGLSHYDLCIDDSVAVSGIDASATEVLPPDIKDGLHDWLVRVYDRAGNHADSKVFSLAVDTTPAETTATLTPSGPNGQNGWYLSEPSLSLLVDETATIYYCLDAGEYQTYESTLTIPEGVHSISFYSVDLADNKEQEKAIEIKVDCSPPEISASISSQRQDNLFVVNEPMSFTYSATDSVSGIESIYAKIDDMYLSDGSTVSFIKPGDYKLEVFAVDKAGNEASLTKEFSVKTLYDFKWLPPINKKCGKNGKARIINHRSTLPVKFSILDSLGRFVADESVKVVVSDGANSEVYSYGKGKGKIRIGDDQYLLNLRLRELAWLKPESKCTVSVYFGGSGEYLGTLCGQIELEVR